MNKRGKIVKDIQYYKFCMYGFLRNLRFFDAFFILFLIEKEISLTQIGLLYAVREITTNLLEVPSGILADTFGRKKALAGSFIFYIVSFILFNLFQSFWLFLIAFMVYGMENVRKPLLTGAISDQVPGEILTSVLSAQSLLRTILASLLALVFGFLADRLGVGISLLTVSSLLLLTALLLPGKKGLPLL